MEIAVFLFSQHFSEIHVTLNDQFKNIIEQSMLPQGFDIHVCAFICNRSKCGNVCSPWSYWMKWEASVDLVVYFFITLSSMMADPLNREKHPGEQSTHPRTCSVAFCIQWPSAYSNFWYQTIGPEIRSVSWYRFGISLYYNDIVWFIMRALYHLFIDLAMIQQKVYFLKSNCG